MHGAVVIKMAIRGLQRTLLRSTLACLGIIIGVASLIAVVAVLNSGIAHGKKRFAQTPERQITISAVPSRRSSIQEITSRELLPDQRLSLDDYFAIRDGVNGLVAVSPQIMLSYDVRANGRHIQSQGVGVDTTGLELAGGGARKVIQGAMFSAYDVAAATNVCLVTDALADELRLGNNPVGQYLYIGKTPFLIVGVVESRQVAGEPDRADLFFYCPYSSVLKRLNRKATFRVLAMVSSIETLSSTRAEIVALLAKRWHPRNSDFVLTDVTDVQNRNVEAQRLVARILISIMCISLIVGGVGIMNIMYANVTERTREIGVRLAVGTRARDILYQFLFEAAILSSFGGMIGIALGIGAGGALVFLFDWPFVLSPASLCIAFMSSCAVGIIFGYTPAVVASKLDPIAALRHE